MIAVASDIEPILKKYQDATRDQLIPLLQDVQDKLGYLPREAIVAIARCLNLPAAKVYGVATFYNQFRFNAPGKHHIQVCRGTACHVKGSATVLSSLERLLKVEAGQTTADGQFSLEVVACIGACGLAPVVCVDGKFHAAVTPQSIEKIIAEYRNAD